jgi:hypothetical protein
MKTESILDEIRRIRDEHAKQFNYDLDAIFADHRRYAAELKKQGWKFAKPAPRQRVPAKQSA